MFLPVNADDDAELRFVVQLRRDRRIPRNRVGRAADAGRRLGEEDRRFRNLELAAARLRALLRVADVVQAEAHDVLRGPSRRRVPADGVGAVRGGCRHRRGQRLVDEAGETIPAVATLRYQFSQCAWQAIARDGQRVTSTSVSPWTTPRRGRASAGSEKVA